MLLTYKPHCQGEVLWGNWVTHCFFFLFPNPLILVLQSREKSFVRVQFRALWFSISHLQSCEKSLLWQRAFLLWAINWLRCDSNMVNSLILTSLSSPVFQNLSENLVHGANVPEQPGGLSLHRLWLQHHVPAAGELQDPLLWWHNGPIPPSLTSVRGADLGLQGLC